MLTTIRDVTTEICSHVPTTVSHESPVFGSTVLGGFILVIDLRIVCKLQIDVDAVLLSARCAEPIWNCLFRRLLEVHKQRKAHDSAVIHAINGFATMW